MDRIELKYNTLDQFQLTVPEIGFIKKSLESILKYVDFNSNGKKVKIDGFRLKDVDLNFANFPTSLSEIFWGISNSCNLKCEFCYERGNPYECKLNRRNGKPSNQEIITRIRKYNPKNKTGILPVRKAINEPFTNPNALMYLKEIRKKSNDELISIVTNGTCLNEDLIEKLQAIKPLFLNISIYTLDKDNRKNILHDKSPDSIIKVIPLLKKYQIPYSANVVMWPGMSEKELKETILFLEENDVTLIRICLGAYSKKIKPKIGNFKLEDYWPQFVEWTNNISKESKSAIIIEPSSYILKNNKAIISAVIKNTPAYFAGVRAKDEVISVNGIKVNSRMHFITLLRGLKNAYQSPGILNSTYKHKQNKINNIETISLVIKRKNEIIEIQIQKNCTKSLKHYPYNQIHNFNDFSYGFVITDSIKYSSIQFIIQKTMEYQAQKILIATSKIIKPIVNKMISEFPIFNKINYELSIPKNIFFGGTVCLGDLLVVSDYIDWINNYIKNNKEKPDIVFIPESSFSSSFWKFDLTGTSFKNIEQKTKVKVELIPCRSITY
jgi:sulfatase maturation enzyme AslB (radical SAM superfamily)